MRFLSGLDAVHLEEGVETYLHYETGKGVWVELVDFDRYKVVDDIPHYGAFLSLVDGGGKQIAWYTPDELPYVDVTINLEGIESEFENIFAVPRGEASQWIQMYVDLMFQPLLLLKV